MITEEFMKDAALELDGMLLDRLPERGELDFSPAFERKMKKLISIFLICLILVFGFVSCSNSEADSESNENSEQNQKTEVKYPINKE